jgi:hypothetical protein
MTREDIICMAREAGLATHVVVPDTVVDIFEKFAKLVAEHEREECRLIVLDNSDAEGICCTDDALEAFRQREET